MKVIHYFSGSEYQRDEDIWVIIDKKLSHIEHDKYIGYVLRHVLESDRYILNYDVVYNHNDNPIIDNIPKEIMHRFISTMFEQGELPRIF